MSVCGSRYGGRRRLSLPSLIYCGFLSLAFFSLSFFFPNRLRLCVSSNSHSSARDRLVAKSNSSGSEGDPSTWGVAGWGEGSEGWGRGAVEGGMGVMQQDSLSELRAVVLGDPAVIRGRWHVLELSVPARGKTAASPIGNQTQMCVHQISRAWSFNCLFSSGDSAGLLRCE